MSFLAAYQMGQPVYAERPGGKLDIVVGFFWFEGRGVSWCDDERLAEQPTHEAYHHLTGDVTLNPDGSLLCDTTLFREITQSSSVQLIAAWNQDEQLVTDMMALHDEVEFDLKSDRIKTASESLSSLQPSGPQLT